MTQAQVKAVRRRLRGRKKAKLIAVVIGVVLYWYWTRKPSEPEA